jgi:Prenyltransferase and squalene oxidase repeat
MKIKVVCFLLAGCLLVLPAWLVHVPSPTPQGVDPPAKASEVPEKYRDTVSKGLEYLVKHQHKDGHWEGDDGKHPVAMTGLVGLALLMEKDNPRRTGRSLERVNKAKYLANIRMAADWLVDQSPAGRDGLIFSEHPSETARYMQGHGLATIFLAGAYIGEDDEKRAKRLNDALTKAVKYIVKAQSTQGGWYETSKVEGHDFATISATVIQIQALQAAENAGIPVPSGAIGDAQEYLKRALGKYEGKDKPAQDGKRLTDTAAGLGIWSSATTYTTVGGKGEEEKRERERWDQRLKYCRSEIPTGRNVKFGRDELAHYYYAQAVFNNLAGKDWSDYRTTMFDHLQSSQNKDGSWPSAADIGVGPVYSTALWCVVLQLDKRSHPSMARPIEIITTTRGLQPWPRQRFAMTVGGLEAPRPFVTPRGCHHESQGPVFPAGRLLTRSGSLVCACADSSAG